MKKTTFLVSVLLFAFLLCSCRTPASYKYMNDEEEIKRIEIVKLFFDEQRELNQETLNVVEQTEVFIEKFNSISCYVWYGDPLGIELDYVGNAIKIIYQNDEYELVLCNGKAIYNAELGFSNYRGYRVFDKEQFDALINEYLSNENTTV